MKKDFEVVNEFEYFEFQCKIVHESDGTYSYSAKDKDDKALFVGQDYIYSTVAIWSVKCDIESYIKSRIDTKDPVYLDGVCVQDCKYFLRWYYCEDTEYAYSLPLVEADKDYTDLYPQYIDCCDTDLLRRNLCSADKCRCEGNECYFKELQRILRDRDE